MRKLTMSTQQLLSLLTTFGTAWLNTQGQGRYIVQGIRREDGSGRRYLIDALGPQVSRSGVVTWSKKETLYVETC